VLRLTYPLTLSGTGNEHYSVLNVSIILVSTSVSESLLHMTIAHVYNEHNAYKTTISLRKVTNYKTFRKVTTLLYNCIVTDN